MRDDPKQVQRLLSSTTVPLRGCDVAVAAVLVARRQGVGVVTTAQLANEDLRVTLEMALDRTDVGMSDSDVTSN